MAFWKVLQKLFEPQQTLIIEDFQYIAKWGEMISHSKIWLDSIREKKSDKNWNLLQIE